MIGAAEDVLWPGKPPRSEVGLLAPRSAEVWDAKEIAVPNQIQDATNNDLNRATVDYMAEVFDLYLALQHANIPVEFVDEDGLSPQGLKSYRVLYVTEPNIPAEGQQGLVDWVRAGGTLVTVSGAGQRDRYDEPCAVLSQATGIQEGRRSRLLIEDARTLKDMGKGAGKLGSFQAVGVRSVAAAPAENAAATFDDGTPAAIARVVGSGRAVHFAWMPGLSYWKSSGGTKDGLPVGFSESLRNWISWPVGLAQVSLPVKVNHPLVETPVLASPAGIGITLLNWNGESLPDVQVEVRTDRNVTGVESVRHGKLQFQSTSDQTRFALPLGGADIVTLR